MGTILLSLVQHSLVPNPQPTSLKVDTLILNHWADMVYILYMVTYLNHKWSPILQYAALKVECRYWVYWDCMFPSGKREREKSLLLLGQHAQKKGSTFCLYESVILALVCHTAVPEIKAISSIPNILDNLFASPQHNGAGQSERATRLKERNFRWWLIFSLASEFLFLKWRTFFCHKSLCDSTGSLYEK